jgi:Na+-transporting NADH:ubiquinone oxidoreductase subunit NqrC
MILVVVVLFVCVLAVAGAVLALSDARQALDRCDQMQQEIAAATLDYRRKTAAARKKGWETRRRKAAELEARQLVFGAVTEATETNTNGGA